MNTQSLQQLPPEVLQQLQQQGLEIMPDDTPAEDLPAEQLPAPTEAPAADAVAPADSF